MNKRKKVGAGHPSKVNHLWIVSNILIVEVMILSLLLFPSNL